MKLGDIAQLIGGKLEGNASEEVVISGVAPLETAQNGEISFLANTRYQHLLEVTKASAIILPKGEWNLKQPSIICENSYFGFTLLMQHFYNSVQDQKGGISSSAQITDDIELGENISIGAFVVLESGVKIGNNVRIFPGCYIGENTEIGDDTTLYSNVTIRENIKIGNRVIVHPGTVIGSDGFGFAQEKGFYHKIPQIGNVVIEDDVEIGANCCIDRATLGETRIHLGTKLDNLIQIAHNVEIGEHTVVAAQTGISGSTKVGHHCKFGGQVGFVGHITIGDYAICGAQAGITKSIKEKEFVSGYPARPHKQQLKIEAAQSRLPNLLRKVNALEKKIEQLEKKLKSNSYKQ